MRRVDISSLCYALSHVDDQIYMGVNGGADRVTRDGRSSRVISVNGHVDCVYVYDNRIYTLVYIISSDWSVRVYNLDYNLIQLWRHEINDNPNQLVVRKDSVLIPHRGSKTIIQYSLTGEVDKRIPCNVLNDAATWLCVMSLSCDTVILSCDDTVSCIDVGTGDCVWSTDSLEKPRAVCCDDASRAYVAVDGQLSTIRIAVLNGVTGKAEFTLSIAQRIESPSRRY